MEQTKKKDRLALWIFVAMLAGIVFGYLMWKVGMAAVVTAYIKPWGTIFVNLLKFIVVPVVLRTTEDMLLLVPNPLREAASALGLPRSLVIKRIAYRAARSGLITGVLLATARVAGETAPLLFTALSNQFFSWDLTKTMANLPVTINNFVQSPYAYWKELAWSGALLITFTVLALNIGARIRGAERAAK